MKFGRILTIMWEYLREGVERAEHFPVLPSERTRAYDDTLKPENVI